MTIWFYIKEFFKEIFSITKEDIKVIISYFIGLTIIGSLMALVCILFLFIIGVL